MREPTRPIRPEILAAKIEKLENFEQPRLLEEFAAEPRLVRALWFLQWISQPANYPGGLSKFTDDLLLAAPPESVGTQHSVKANSQQGRYKLSDAIEIFRDLPDSALEELFGLDTNLIQNAYGSGDSDEDWSDGPAKPRQSPKIWNAWLLKKLTPESVRRVCMRAARENLADYFKNLCELPHIGFRQCDRRDGEHGAPWYFVAIADALLAYMDVRAEQLQSGLADTEISRLVSRWIVKSSNMKRSVMIIGNSRFGKSEAVKLHAKMYPGSCRFVDTPAFNAISDLLLEVAKSLGLEIGPTNVGRELRERIDYVLRFSRLQMIFDESQRLLPATYSRNTAPARLNWVRRSIMDQEIAAVFVCTPQSYLPAKRQFLKTTGFAMEQFDERILKTVHVPNELSEADLLAVGKIHFGDLPEDYLGYVVDAVLATERNFVSDIEKIAALAKDNAREHGRNRPTRADIDAAIGDVLPSIKPTAMPKKDRTESPVHRRCKPPAEPLPMSRRGLETSSRDRLVRPSEVIA